MASTTFPASTSFRVTDVAANDTLEVHAAPGADTPTVGHLPPDASGLTLVEAPVTVATWPWVHVRHSGADGWVNSAYLTEQLDEQAPCTEPEAQAVVAQASRALRDHDERALADTIDPTRGLRVYSFHDADSIRLRGAYLSDATAHDWPTYGPTQHGTFDEVIEPRLTETLAAAGPPVCAQIPHGGASYAVELPVQLQSIPSVAFARQSSDIDWDTWVFGIERTNGHYRLAYLIPFAWEP